MTLKDTFRTIIMFCGFFVFLWLIEGNVKGAAISTLFFAVTLIVILNTKNIYLHLKMNRFNIKSITSLDNLKYYAISTIIIGLVYVFILPEFVIMMSFIFILCVLGGLLIFDLAKSIFKFR
jgi:hypothetical protein